MDSTLENNKQVINVPIEDIIPNRFQPRLNFDENGLKELASSIKEHGIIQPLILRRLNDKYEIIAGERRYKAAKMAGLMSVPAIISEMDDKKSAEVAIVENVQRRDLSSIEEAKSYKALLDKGYLTQEELAKKMGLSQSAISNKLRLLSLSPKVQDALMAGKISERHARSLLQLSSLEEQDKWLKIVIDERITVKELDNRLKESMNKKEEKEEIKKNTSEIPIIETTPNIEDIKSRAEDIIKPSDKQSNIDVIAETPVNTKIPNKFFNYLEDEQANMNAFDISNFMNSVDDAVKEVEAKEEPEPEEIEMLDFLAPAATTDVKNMDKAYELISKLESDLKDNNYTVKVIKDENDNIIKYTIEIAKN